MFTTTNAKAHEFSAFLFKLFPKVLKLALVNILSLSMFVGISSCSHRFVESMKNTAQEVNQSFQKAQSFQSILVDKYKEKGIVVGLQETSMGKEQIKFISVQFTNTLFNKLTASERKKIARDVAELAKAHFVLHKAEDFVWVGFVESGHYIVFEYSRSVDSYTFKSSELVPVVSNSTVVEFPHDKNQHK